MLPFTLRCIETLLMLISTAKPIHQESTLAEMFVGNNTTNHRIYLFYQQPQIDKRSTQYECVHATILELIEMSGPLF